MRIAEFAKLAGVTVRTLQYYDRIGLLVPERDGTHRVYQRGDLLRLQQILTLKWMGFPLKGIKALLESPAYDLRDSLLAQKHAVDAQIERLQRASAALERAISAAEEVDAETVGEIIRAVTLAEEWMRAPYSDDVWAGIVARGMSITPAQMQHYEQQWADLIADFDAVRGQPPGSPAVQKLAARMARAVDAFTAGDPNTEDELAQMYTEGHVPDEYRMQDEDLERFMREALTIYRKDND